MKFVLYLLALVLTFATPPALSQSKRYIDTEEQCLKIQGAWATSTYGLRGQGVIMKSCHVDMNPYGECGQAGGYNIQNVPDERRCQLPQSELGKIAQCRENRGLWAITGWGFLCYLEADEQKCHQEGGNWKVGGMANLFGCVRTASDAGKSCRDNSECQFGCRYDGPRPAPEEEIVGKCHSSNRDFGCFVAIEKGKLGSGICRD
jgi:hypothetical protein